MRRSGLAVLFAPLLLAGCAAWMPMRSEPGPSPLVWDDGPYGDDEGTVWRGVVEPLSAMEAVPVGNGEPDDVRPTEPDQEAPTDKASLSMPDCHPSANAYIVRDLTRPSSARSYLLPNGVLCKPRGPQP